MSDPIKLQGTSGIFSQSENIKVRKVNEGVSLEQIKQAAAANNLDEIVLEDTKGQRYIAYADELSVKGNWFSSGLPKEGASVEVSFIDGPVKVLYVNDEHNEDMSQITDWVGTGGLGVGSIYNPHRFDQDDSEIKKISTELP
ncbi:MAG TPA: hypothetical protein V6D23_16215 [Candidatus Obscuribacterales bacterium]